MSQSAPSGETPSPQLNVTPVQPPEGAVTPSQARTRERLFLERFERNFARVEQVYSPLDKKFHSTRSVSPVADDPYQRVAEVLQKNGLFDATLLDTLPHNRSLRYEMPSSGFFGRKKPRVIVTATSRSPVGDLARLGGVLSPQGRTPIQEVVQDQTTGTEAYHVIGILSTVGWEEAVRERIPRGENYSLVLVEQMGAAGWRLDHSLPKDLESLLSVFDPEDLDEKVARTFYWVTQQPELKIPGGHLDLGRVGETLGITREVLDLALKQVQHEDASLKVAQVGGREILKRDRY